MDAISDPSIHTVVIMSSAQVGKTEILNNVVGFYVDQDPAPMLLLQPTLEMGQAWSKDRLAPMLRDCPALIDKVKDPASRNSGNTLLHKTFPGGHITIAGANSPASLASRPVRVLLADEVDRYPASAGTEGDPVSLASKRTATFWNRKRVMTSTPTVKDASRIEKAFKESDQRRFWVPCPHCDVHQVLRWPQVQWPEGHPSSALYACIECGVLWSDAERWAAVRHGEWRAGANFAGIAGFHLSELYSPWRRLGETAEDFLAAKADKEQLKAWVNTALGETWEDKGETVDGEAIKELMEPYGPDDVPDAVQFCTAGVDTQDDRLEVEVVGWGEDEESWGIQYSVIYGDPAQDHVWEELDEILTGSFTTDQGRVIRIKCAAIDSGGHHAEAVFRFTKKRFRRKVYAIKGQGGQGRPIWPLRASKSKTAHTVFMVGVDTAKDAIYSRFGIEDAGPGFCHLPSDPDAGYDDQWFSGVTAEQKMTRYKEGRAYYVWQLPKGKRNEPLDCRVYATAAMKAITKKRKKPARPAPEKPAASDGDNWLGSDGWIDNNKDWLA